jgi:hypothetical protein
MVRPRVRSAAGIPGPARPGALDGAAGCSGIPPMVALQAAGSPPAYHRRYKPPKASTGSKAARPGPEMNTHRPPDPEAAMGREWPAAHDLAGAAADRQRIAKVCMSFFNIQEERNHIQRRGRAGAAGPGHRLRRIHRGRGGRRGRASFVFKHRPPIQMHLPHTPLHIPIPDGREIGFIRGRHNG